MSRWLVVILLGGVALAGCGGKAAVSSRSSGVVIAGGGHAAGGGTATTGAVVSRSAAHPLVAPGAAASLIVSDRGPGTRLPAGFIGLGLEANTLAGNEFAHSDLAGFMDLLDPHGLLRIGGNSVESFWTSTGEPAPAWSHGEITPADLRALAVQLKGTGWRVILGLAFKHNTPARAADEARYAQRILGPELDAIEIGNEPNLYGISRAAYFAGFERFVSAIQTVVPGVAIAGPAAGRAAPKWVDSFAQAEAGHPDVALFTAHEYPLSHCNGEHPTIADLLSTASERNEATVASRTVAAARSLGVPAVIDETNSVICWGEPGVSDTYASALWILDYGLLMARDGVAAANFQDRIRGCTPYLPLCTRADGTSLYARPEFYGLLALKAMGSGRFLDESGLAGTTLRSFAVENAPGRLSLALDNLGAASRRAAVHLPGRRYDRAASVLLTTRSAAGLRATGGVTIGAETVGSGGRMDTLRDVPVQVSGGTVTVAVPAHAAVILKVS